jgi:protein gp37
MNHTSIEWTHRPETGGAAGGFTWNPIRARLTGQGEKVRSGTFCTRISPGCTNCYASVINKRFGNGLEFTVPNLEKIEYFVSEKILEEPLRRKKPATIFVGDMFDLFHEAIPENLIIQVLAVMALCPNHTFQLLTKRAERMRDIFDFDYSLWGEVADAVEAIGYTISPCIGHLVDELRDGNALPLKNLWLGVSVEDQKRAIERIPRLQETPAAVRFLSVEPQLEEIDFEPESIDGMPTVNMLRGADWCDPPIPGIDWVVCGGESGRDARPCHPDWVRSVRDQCIAAKVPFFFKQWGEWQPHQTPPERDGDYHGGVFLLSDGQLGNQGDWWAGRAHAMDRVGKNKAGHLLDGREWLEFPTERLVTA